LARFVVAAAVNLDRISRLTAPLRPGRRHHVVDVETRLGGGGYTTGEVLLAAGHAVALVSSLADDGDGRDALAALRARGFDTDAIEIRPGLTRPYEILVDPTGERTILGPADHGRQPLAALPETPADAIYLNPRRMSAEALAGLARYPLVVAQYPLEAGERRPAEVIVASRGDLGGLATGEIHRRAGEVAGPRHRLTVITDGPAPITLAGPAGTDLVEVAALPAGTDTTGAGDLFVGGLLDGLVRGLPPAAATAAAATLAARRLAERARAGRAAGSR
jgi:sugar/nucleoside kinase (ribokinase family)